MSVRARRSLAGTGLSSGGSHNRRHRPDYVLVLLSALLLAVGLIVVYSISPALSAGTDLAASHFVSKQLMAIALGVVAFAVVAAVPLGRWPALQRPLLIAASIATLITLVMPVSPEYPAHRWIRFGGMSLQSVELVKFALIICLGVFLDQCIKKRIVDKFKTTLKPILLALAVVGGVVAVLQRDLGSAAVILAIAAAMTFIAGLPVKRLLLALAAVMVAAMLFILPFGYRRDRITSFINPERDCQNTGYQACQALIAVGSGGLLGKGLADSGQAYGYLPEAANDSIFAIVAEKFGFIGASSLILLLMAVFIRIKNIMERAPDEFSRLAVAGILAWLSTQTIINVGSMIGLLPLKGITLPFVSYGGTSVVFVMAAIGLVFSISRYTSYTVQTGSKEGRSREDITFGRRHRRAHHAAFGRRA